MSRRLVQRLVVVSGNFTLVNCDIEVILSFGWLKVMCRWEKKSKMARVMHESELPLQMVNWKVRARKRNWSKFRFGVSLSGTHFSVDHLQPKMSTSCSFFIVPKVTYHQPVSGILKISIVKTMKLISRIWTWLCGEICHGDECFWIWYVMKEL